MLDVCAGPWPDRVAADGNWWSWLTDNTALLTWLGVLSIASLVLVALVLPVMVVRLPPDYFLASRSELAARRGVLGWLERIVRNAFGVVFVLVGIALIFLPGQGLLTTLIGLLLLDFPGKRALERRIVRQPKLLAVMNRLREKRGKPPLLVDRDA